MPLAAERVTVMSLVPSLSPTLAVDGTDTVGWESLSFIVPVPVGVEMEALEAELMVTITVSLLSLRVSPVTVTSMSLEVSPAEKVRVPAVIAV